MIEPVNLILASTSPRRKQLLALGNWTFQVIVSDIDENRHVDEKADAYVLRLAREKTLAVAHKAGPQSIILGSDTSVIHGDEILGKPQNAQDAVRMLRQLRGRTHQVYTGIAIHRPSDGLMLTDMSITDVPMRAYSDDEINVYVATGDPLDKAGAYAIQHPDFHPVESMSGCYAGVMGLPMCHVLRLLSKVELSPEADVPLACQSLLKYQCPVSSAILRGETV